MCVTLEQGERGRGEWQGFASAYSLARGVHSLLQITTVTRTHSIRGESDWLDADRERLVLESVRVGDRQALETLLLSHLPLVHAIAARYARRGQDRDDLIAEGILGLVEAARRFDHDRGVRFSTYAAWWVRAQVRRYSLRTMRIVGAPSTRVGRRLLAQLPAAQRRLSQVLGRAPNRQELATELQATDEEVACVDAALRGADRMFEEGSAATLAEGSAQPTPEGLLAAAQGRALLLARVERAMGAMSERERQIVRRRLLDEERTTLSALGQDLGISRERVRQLEERARAKLRNALLDVA